MVPWCHQVHAAPYGRFHCGDPWVDEDGREWLTLEICADSFLTHQIRKMVATAALVPLA